MLHVIRLFWLVILCGPMYTVASNSDLERRYLESLNGAGDIGLTPDLKVRMQAISDAYNSDTFRNNVTKYSDSLKRVLNVEEGTSSEEEVPMPAPDRPILFISAAIPLDVLRKYAEQLHGAGGGTMVLRGFVGGARKMMPTLKFIASIINIDPSCEGAACKKYIVDIIVDPILFKHHGVERVPAFMVYESSTYIERCKGSDATEIALLVYGDASIRGLALELKTIDNRPTVQRFIKKAGYDK